MKWNEVRPVAKVGVGALAGALTVVLIWFVQAIASIEIPAEVASAITVLFTFFSSWFTPEGEKTVPLEVHGD